MNTSSSTDDIAYQIRSIFVPILLTFGIPGNTLCIIILYRLRKTQHSTYLVCLATADLILLSIWKLFDWIASLIGLNFTDILCRIQIYGYISCLQIASWMQVLVTVERAISVAFPHKVRTLFSPVRSVVSVGLISTAFLGLNSSFFTAPEADVSFNSDKYCFDNHNFTYEPTNIWPWIYLFLGYFTPWLLLFIGNIVIVTILRRKLNGSNSISLSHDVVSGRRQYKVSIVTKRVVALNLVYNICVSPLSILTLLTLFGVTASKIVNTILTMFMLLNNSSSFFLYILIGSRFRQELVKMMSICKCPPFVSENRNQQTGVCNTRF